MLKKTSPSMAGGCRRSAQRHSPAIMPRGWRSHKSQRQTVRNGSRSSSDSFAGWAIETGRVDILLETSLLASCLAMPRVGHLQQALHVLGCLKLRPKRKLAFDPAHPMLMRADSRNVADWTEFCRDASEAIPGNMPKPRGNCMTAFCFVDANCAGSAC